MINTFEAKPDGDGWSFKPWRIFNVNDFTGAKHQAIEHLNREVNTECVAIPDFLLFVRAGDKPQAELLEVVPETVQLQHIGMRS